MDRPQGLPGTMPMVMKTLVLGGALSWQGGAPPEALLVGS